MLAPGGAAQAQIELQGPGDPELDRRLRTLLDLDYRLLATDTLIPAGDTLHGPVVVAGSRLLLEGVVAGDLVGLDADLFLRPSALVTGDLVNVAGGIYRSALARVEGAELDRPLAPYLLLSVPGGFILEGRAEVRSWVPEGFKGIVPPVYDRVNGVSLRTGAAYHFSPRGTWQPRVAAHVVYRSARGALDGGGEVALSRWPVELALGAARTTDTNENWIRGPLLNSLSYFFLGSDYRDYYAADRVYGRLAAELETESWRIRPSLLVQWEDARSLRARSPWTVFDPDSLRPNFPVDDGELVSATGTITFSWRSADAELLTELLAEVGRDDDEADFGRAAITGSWLMNALFGHRLEVEWHALAPLPGTDSVPARRWSFVGGSGTLKTFERARFRGDRLVFVETDYIIPLPERWAVFAFGAPEIELRHAAGMAWRHGESRDLEQNVGARVRLGFFFVGAVTDPTRARDDLEFDFGVSSTF